MSQDPELVSNRTISGKGVLKIPVDVARIRYLNLYADVLRDPVNPYLNLNYNPPRSRYATLTFLRDGYVQFEHALEYQRQAWDFIADYTSQTLIALKCAYSGILESFANLGIALGATPVSIIDTIKDYEYLVLLFDEIRVVCYADTAIQLRLYTTANDTCDPDKDLPRKPPAPPAPSEKVEPGTPIPDISLPYEEGSNPSIGDDGNTYPAPVDIPDYFPSPDARGCPGTWRLLDNWSGHPTFTGYDEYAGFELDLPEWRRTPGSSVAWQLYASGTDERVIFATPGIGDPSSTLFYTERTFTKTDSGCISPSEYNP